MLNLKNGFTKLGLITGILLLIPLIAMQYTQEVNWTLADFIIMALLCFSLGSAYILISRKMPQQKMLFACLCSALFVYIWAELAVGVWF